MSLVHDMRWNPKAALRSALPISMMIAIAAASSGPLLVDVSSGGDKTLHAVAFGALGLAWLWALEPTRLPAVGRRGVAFLSAALWGILDEMHQAYVPQRAASVADAAADVVGAGAVILGSWLAARWFGPRRGPRR